MLDAPPVQLLDGMNADSFAADAATQPLYELVRSGLSELIDQHFEDGQRFWPENVMSERLNVSRVTLRRALQSLSRDGSLTRFRARGTFVRKAGVRKGAPVRSTTGLKSIGVFVPHFDSQFTSDMLDEFFAAASERNISMNVYRTHKGDVGDRAIKQVVADSSTQAIILFAIDPKLMRDLYIQLESNGYRVITVDVLLPDHPSSHVGTNNDMGVRLGLNHLISLGHKEIVFLLNEPEDATVCQIRLNAFLAGARDHGLTGARVVNAHQHLWDDPILAAYNSMDEVWNGACGHPTAIMCASDAGADGALRWLSEHDISVPGQVSVMGFDDDRTSRYMNPPLTTIAHPRPQIARRAIEILSDNRQSHEFLAPSLVVRKSTAPANSVPI